MDSTFNNVQVKFTTLAFSTQHMDLSLMISQLRWNLINKVDDNWANGLYMQGATLTVVNDSWFGQSGGSAFHISDNRQVMASITQELKLTIQLLKTMYLVMKHGLKPSINHCLQQIID